MSVKASLLKGISEETVKSLIPIQTAPLEENPEVMFVRSEKLNEGELPKSLFAICRAGSGVDNIPVDWCTKNGIVVFNAPGANANAVAEWTLWAIITASRNFASALEFVKNNRYLSVEELEKTRGEYRGYEIRGKSIYVIGAGKIGSAVIRNCRALGMKVFAHDPWAKKENFSGATEVKKLEGVPECDFVTLHIAYTKKTAGLIGKKFFERMKNGTVLVNSARGEIVDRESLKDALKSDKISVYVTDFHNHELALLFPKSFVSLPHLGASTHEAEEGATETVAKQLLDFWNSGEIRNSVNFQAFLPEERRENTVRFVICNLNIPGIIHKVTGVFSEFGYNVCYDGHPHPKNNPAAYMIFDIDNPDRNLETAMQKISRIEGVTKIRLIK